jgi:hypothetical protein
MSNLQRLYPSVPRMWERYVFGAVAGRHDGTSGGSSPRAAVRTRLVPPAHGDSSGVRGAAWLWPDGPV